MLVLRLCSLPKGVDGRMKPFDGCRCLQLFRNPNITSPPWKSTTSRLNCKVVSLSLRLICRLHKSGSWRPANRVIDYISDLSSTHHNGRVRVCCLSGPSRKLLPPLSHQLHRFFHKQRIIHTTYSSSFSSLVASC